MLTRLPPSFYAGRGEGLTRGTRDGRGRVDDGHAGEVVRATGLAAAPVSATLALLELKGIARDAGGMQYARVLEAPAACAPRTGAGAPAPQPTEGETP